MSQKYSTPASVMLPSTVEMLETTKRIYSNGITIAGAASAGTLVIKQGGTRSYAVKVALYEFAKDEILPVDPDEPGRDLAMTATSKGISLFQDEIRRVKENQQDSIDAKVGAGGQMIVRRN